MDDMPLARAKLRRYLTCEPGISIVGECGSATDALAAILEHSPELLFLDVEMPDIDGFGLLKRIDPAQIPIVIFLTAYDHYAIQAFEVHAVDYLLKPLNRERLSRALARARTEVMRRRTGGSDNRLGALLADTDARKRVAERIPVRTGERTWYVPVEEINYIEAAGNYLCLHVGRETHILRDTLSTLEKLLDPAQFIRIHRSYLVRLSEIMAVESPVDKEQSVVLKNGARLPLARTCYTSLKRLLTLE